jgi:protein SCO1/2
MRLLRTVLLLSLAGLAVTIISERAALQAAGTTGAGVSGPAFRLMDQAGRAVDAQALADKPTIVHFGFTHCPVVCPTTLHEMSERIRDLGPLADRMRFVFVTVDPERDTPEHLGRYLASFDPRIVGLTGTESQVKALADGLGATFTKRTDDRGEHTFDHSIFAYLMARGWSRAGTLYMGSDARTGRVLARLEALAAD